MFNKEKITVPGLNRFSSEEYVDCIPLFIPDECGPWAVRYIWMKNNDDNFLENYHSKTGVKANVRRSTAHLEQYWIPHNCLMINQGHLGNIVWRIKTTNPFNNSIDIIEVWRSRKHITDLFSFDHGDTMEIEQATQFNSQVAAASPDIKTGGTGLRNGSGLTINDNQAPRYFSKTDSEALGRGLYEIGFDIRSWNEFPMIGKQQAVDIYTELKTRSLTSKHVNINTGWNSELNPL
jgi:hypothetical protein